MHASFFFMENEREGNFIFLFMIGLLLAGIVLMKYDPILFKIFAILEIVGGGNPPAKL